MVAEDTLVFKKGHADGDRERAVRVVKLLYRKNVSIGDLAEAVELPEDEVLRILSEE